MFQTVTYAAQPVDALIAPEVKASAKMADSLAAFLLRVATYFQGYLASLPRPSFAQGYHASHESLDRSMTVIDAALDSAHEPLIRVRMNRALSRRMRWLIRRGRVQRSGRLRVYNPEAEQRCNLSPGQFIDYSIRVCGHSRVRAYGMGLARRALRLRGFLLATLQGDILSLHKAALCAAPLSPD